MRELLPENDSEITEKISLYNGMTALDIFVCSSNLSRNFIDEPTVEEPYRAPESMTLNVEL